MNHRIILSFLLCFISLTGYAQKEISFSQLERLFKENNPGYQAKMAELDIYSGRKLDAAKRPEPVLSAGYESVSNGSRESEATFVLSQELDLKNVRRLRLRSLDHEKKALSFQLMHEFRTEITEIKRKFCKAAMLERDIAALRKVLAAIEEVEARSLIRLAAGDIAEVDVMRLTAEKNKVAFLIADIESEASLEQKNLSLTLGMASQTLIVDMGLPRLPEKLNIEALQKKALAGGNDLKAIHARISAAEAQIVAAKKEPGSSLTLEGGYKTRNGGFKGFVVGISTPLPLSKSNKGKIQELQAKRSMEELRLVAKHKNLVGQIEMALEKFCFLADREAKLVKQIKEHAKIAKIARFNFEAGEAGLLEILDAVRNQSDLILQLNQTIMESYFIVFNLEYLTGLELTNKENRNASHE